MSDKLFLDSNVAIYALDAQSIKGQIAIGLLEARPTISTQVIMKTVNVMLRKLQFERSVAYEHAQFLAANCDVVSVSSTTVLHALELSESFGFTHWDSLVAAAALEAGCTQLLSEDFQHGPRLRTLTITNPFI